MFCDICPCANDIVYAKFEDFRTFLCVFMSVKFSCAKSKGYMYQWPSFFYGGQIEGTHQNDAGT